VAAGLLETGQTTCYHVFDDGDLEIGIDKAYTVLTLGDYSGNTNIEVAHYAGNQISFAAIGNIVADVAAGLVTFLAGDTVVVKGTTNNDGVYTVAVGGVAGQFTTVEALVNEAAGPYVSFYKRTAHSNNAIDDDNTGLQWSRNTSTGERIGPVSGGTLAWYDVAAVFTLHPAAADLQMIAATNTIRIVGGAGEVNRYHIGDLLDCAGFANAVNNLPGYYVVSVTINGANLDIVLDPGNEVLIAEAAGGARSIGLVCRTCFNYMAGARLANLNNLADWRVPNLFECLSLADFEAPTALPDAVAFPGWPAHSWTSTTRPDIIASIFYILWTAGYSAWSPRNGATYTALVRG